VFVSEDYGQSWRAINDGLPDGWSVNVIIEHQRAPDLLFVGNEVGVYVSIDRGDNWTRLKNNLPVVPVDDLLIHPRENDLIVGTHGRSIWILPDVAPLEHLSTETLAEAGQLFPQKLVTMWAQRGGFPFSGATFSAPNPPRGVLIRYYLRDAVADGGTTADDDGGGIEDEEREAEDGGDEGEDVSPDGSEDSFTLTITDASGDLVRSLDAPGSAGINEVVWNWRHDAPYEPEEGTGNAPAGPIALPGTYTVSMEVGGQGYATTVEIIADPRRPMSRADRVARQDALLSLRALAKPIYEATQAAQRLDRRVGEAEELLEAHDGESEALTTELEAIKEELSSIQSELGTVRGNAGGANAIQGSSTLPTSDQLWRIDQAWEALPGVVERLNELILTRVPAFNAMLDAEGVRPNPGDAITVPTRRGGVG
jgi:hypothetical protein